MKAPTRDGSTPICSASPVQTGPTVSAEKVAGDAAASTAEGMATGRQRAGGGGLAAGAVLLLASDDRLALAPV